VKRKSTSVRVGAAFLLAPGPAMAADGVLVSNTETVQAHLNADGTVKDARVYEQVALQGNGTVTIKNPVSTANLRNLDGFGGFDVTGGNMVSTQTVNGEKRMRAVSDFKKTLPLKVSATYKLDGKTVEPGDVVGKSGRLEVHYKVDNVTGKDQPVTFDDGTGNKVTQTQKVVIPMVGSLTTLLPSGFTDVQSDEASMAGDGNGGTSMTFTMTLFGPIGSATSEFGYSAAVQDGVIPDANVSALPVSPLDNPSFKGGAASYKAGADAGVTLTSGATQIDANVLKLRDGAATLIAGLIQLRDGAHTLNDGLAGQAAPGAFALADGASKLNIGARLLRTAFKSPSGAADLTNGSAALAVGVGQLSSGLKQLSGVAGLPSGLAGLQDLRAGLDHPVHALGATDPGGLLQGLQQIAGGLSNPACNPAAPTAAANPCGVKQGLASVKLGITNPACSLTNPTNPANPCGILQVVDEVGGKLTAASATAGAIDQLGAAAIGAYTVSACPSSTALGITVPVPPVIPPSSLEAAPFNLAPNSVCVLIANVAYGLKLPAGVLSSTDPGGLKAQTAAAGAGLGLTGSGINAQLLPGLALLRTGVDKLSAGSVTARDAVSKQVLPGVDLLIAGITDAVTGSAKLSAGALAASSGSSDLAAGIVKAGAGAGQLSDGTVLLSDGANTLASGLGDAAAGSAQLADGMDTAATGGEAIPAGATQLSAEGSSKLVEAGKATASDYGLKYAVLVAGAERAKAEGMAYGAPAGASGATAYSLDISGANKNGGTNAGRGVGALALFGAGGALVFFRRRLV
jgi:putative membrane protein